MSSGVSFNLIQLFGFVLLGGVVAGEVSRRVLGLPRTTGYVVLGLLVGQSGFQWIGAQHVEAAQLFIDLALGLILFELGYQISPQSRRLFLTCLKTACALAVAVVGATTLLMKLLDFSLVYALLGGLICLATSPAITVATSSDVGAKGERTELLFALVAINGCLAYLLITLVSPFAVPQEPADVKLALVGAVAQMGYAILLSVVGAFVVVRGAILLGRNIGQQHLLILGVILAGVGSAIMLGLSAMLPMLLCGVLIRNLDRQEVVTPIRIASDARIFLVITFVLAGAVLDVSLLKTYWFEALALVTCRFLSQCLVLHACRNSLGLDRRDAFFMVIGLQPMSSVAVVLLATHQDLSNKGGVIAGIILCAILLMQLLGPLATQTAIKAWGEASSITKRF